MQLSLPTLQRCAWPVLILMAAALMVVSTSARAQAGTITGMVVVPAPTTRLLV